MLDHLKGQAMGRRETTRLVVLVGLALVAGVAMAGSRSCGRGETPPSEESALVTTVDPSLGKPVPIERERVLAVGDEPAAHHDDAYERGALDYLLSVAERALAETPRRVAPEELAKVPFADAAGHAFEIAGTVAELFAREFRTPQQRLWTLVLQGKDGGRLLVLRKGLTTDPREGAPRAADATWVEVGDRVVVRGTYLQRRSGTIGDTVLREPVPVLVLSQARKAPEPKAPIEDPSRAYWDEVEDRFLAETQRWEEHALFQILQWAQERGPAKVREDILSGRIPWKEWDRDVFMTWEKEIEVTSVAQARPFTDAARGKLWRFRGLVGEVLLGGWDVVPPNEHGVDQVYVWDVLADDWTQYGRGIDLRCFSPFPPDAFPGITGKKAQAVHAYGLFLKNYTYVSRMRSAKKPGAADITAPAFLILHLESVPPPERSNSLWLLAGSMVVLAGLFYLTLIRGERKEAKRMEVYRRDLRQRMRKAGQGPVAGTWPPTDEGPPPDASETRPPEERGRT